MLFWIQSEFRLYYCAQQRPVVNVKCFSYSCDSEFRSLEYINAFKGPKFGIAGIRKTLNIYNRPLLGTIIKPKLGLNPEEHAKVAFEAWLGGCDLVKDDENLK